MGALILKKGTKANLPASDTIDTLLITTDTHEMYRGTGTGLANLSNCYFAASLAAFPASGITNKLYIAIDTRQTYIWNGSSYQTASDAHAHSNKSVLDLLTFADTHLKYNGASVAFLSELNDGLAAKVDNVTYAADMALKADADDMADALALKADADDMAAGLALKVNITDNTTAMALKADLVGGIVPVAQLPADFRDSRVAADITARNALTGLGVGTTCWVVDATADTTVAAGAALYIYNGTVWSKMAEAESMDIDFAPYMLIASYDSNSDGQVDSADEADALSGAAAAGNSKYYGTNPSGTAGFFTLPVMEWTNF